MAQTIKTGKTGSTAMRVLEAVTPLTGTVAPAVNANYIGQIYVDITAKTAYMAVALASVTPANDWKQITLV